MNGAQIIVARGGEILVFLFFLIFHLQCMTNSAHILAGHVISISIVSVCRYLLSTDMMPEDWEGGGDALTGLQSRSRRATHTWDAVMLLSSLKTITHVLVH